MLARAQVLGVTGRGDTSPACLHVGVGHGRQSLDCRDLEIWSHPVTHEDLVYDRRVRLIEYAAKTGNITQACRVFGVSRKSYYEWINKAEQYGLSALLPKDRRRPNQPNEMSSEEVAVTLSEAVARPTLGPRSLLRHLRKRGVDRSASGVAKVLRRHNLGRAKARVAVGQLGIQRPLNDKLLDLLRHRPRFHQGPAFSRKPFPSGSWHT